MSKTAVCPMCGLDYDPEDGLVHDEKDGEQLCYDCTMKIRNAVPEELGGAPTMEEPPSVNCFTVKSAKAVLNVLDPVKGVLGKDADLIVRTEENGLSIAMADQGGVSEIEVSVDLKHENIIDHDTGRAYVCVPLDKLINALKTFGSDESVTIAAQDSEIILQSNMATWKIPQIRMDGTRKKLHAVTIDSDADATVTVQALKRILAAEYMAEVFKVTVEDRVLKMTAEAESGREGLTVREFQTVTADFPVSSQFGYDLMKDIFSRIHTDGGVDMGLMNRGPMELEWRQGAAGIRAVFAPRD